jgi:hypothetical protein
MAYADRSARARLVQGHDGLVQQRGGSLRERPHGRVGAAAGSSRHDQLNRPVRKELGPAGEHVPAMSAANEVDVTFRTGSRDFKRGIFSARFSAQPSKTLTIAVVQLIDRQQRKVLSVNNCDLKGCPLSNELLEISHKVFR